MKTTLTKTQLTKYLKQFKLTNITITINPLLPPITTTYTTNNKLELQINNLHTIININLKQNPTQLNLYINFKTNIQITINNQTNTQNQINITLLNINNINTHIISTNTSNPLITQFIKTLIQKTIINLFIQNFITKLNQTYPIPIINLNNLINNFPTNTKITFNTKTTQIKSNHIILNKTITTP